MTQLILAYQEARDDSGIDQLLLVPCFILVFYASIHLEMVMTECLDY